MRNKWKKIALVTADFLLGGYLVAAFTAFNKPDESSRLCTKVTINIADNNTDGFITAQEIRNRLKVSGLYPLDKPLRYADTRRIEETLKKSPFVKTAECYKTQEGNVNISISQMTPVIRIKADNGDDYYIDDKNTIMPNSHYASDLIIATGSISRKYATTCLSPLARAIQGNELWRNGIVQINIQPDQGLELVPRVGNHIVYIGQLPQDAPPAERDTLIAGFIDRKLSRLEKFYKYGLSQAGWNKYSYINLEFDNQIICKKRHHKEDNNEIE